MTIVYKASVRGDLARIDPVQRQRIRAGIERGLRSDGHDGEALRGPFAGLYRLRVGAYRVIYARVNTDYLVLRIAHRRNVYRRR